MVVVVVGVAAAAAAAAVVVVLAQFKFYFLVQKLRNSSLLAAHDQIYGDQQTLKTNTKNEQTKWIKSTNHNSKMHAFFWPTDVNLCYLYAPL